MPISPPVSSYSFDPLNLIHASKLAVLFVEWKSSKSMLLKVTRPGLQNFYGFCSTQPQNSHAQPPPSIAVFSQFLSNIPSTI